MSLCAYFCKYFFLDRVNVDWGNDTGIQDNKLTKNVWLKNQSSLQIQPQSSDVCRE